MFSSCCYLFFLKNVLLGIGDQGPETAKIPGLNECLVLKLILDAWISRKQVKMFLSILLESWPISLKWYVDWQI